MKYILFIITLFTVLTFQFSCVTMIRADRCYKKERICQDKCTGYERQIKKCDEQCYNELLLCLETKQ